MNKTVLLLLFFCFLGYGQKLIVTPEGFKNSEELTKKYVVIDVEGKTAKDLYENALRFINKNYKNPEKVITGKVENEFISINTHATDFITIKNSFAKIPISTDYNYDLSFKDNRVKFEVTEIDMYDKSGKFKLKFKGEGAFSGYYIYNMKDELKKPEAKAELENYFNSFIIVMSNYLKSTVAEDKW
ncbi:hypothetical protein RT99_05865 [Flavobacterium sp. MEB061]|uniref:DUF4468 domain-containing protein n=1 Tax=Flavobacterium sp. MEB061 TaxID=1587524 RepID=UPI0005AC26CF|nr:DUF4468 domain-containing protein [Flavobacterium sp. MEB061]KIQ22633.1 hypothetical protein RT99_05865 [Flavobacterium sp. MEB061]